MLPWVWKLLKAPLLKLVPLLSTPLPLLPTLPLLLPMLLLSLPKLRSDRLIH